MLMLQVQLDLRLKQCHQNPAFPSHNSSLLCVSFILSLHSTHRTILPLVEADCNDIFSKNITLYSIVNKGRIKLFSHSALVCCDVKFTDKSIEI